MMEPYPPVDAPRWGVWLASWCERHPQALGRALTGATAGVLLAVVVLGAVRS